MPTIAERVKNVVVDHLGVDEAKVVDGAGFFEDLGADSLDHIELVMAFEEEFDIIIADEDADAFITVRDVVKHIEKTMGNAHG